METIRTATVTTSYDTVLYVLMLLRVALRWTAANTLTYRQSLSKEGPHVGVPYNITVRKTLVSWRFLLSREPPPFVISSFRAIMTRLALSIAARKRAPYLLPLLLSCTTPKYLMVAHFWTAYPGSVTSGRPARTGSWTPPLESYRQQVAAQDPRFDRRHSSTNLY